MLFKDLKKNVTNIPRFLYQKFQRYLFKIILKKNKK